MCRGGYQSRGATSPPSARPAGKVNTITNVDSLNNQVHNARARRTKSKINKLYLSATAKHKHIFSKFFVR
jgi:hypothetical protein